jgi:Flp pilus assembly pilin Flp
MYSARTSLGESQTLDLGVRIIASARTHCEGAQGLVEYGLIIALVAVLAIAGLIIFGPAVSSLLSNVGGSV